MSSYYQDTTTPASWFANEEHLVPFGHFVSEQRRAHQIVGKRILAGLEPSQPENSVFDIARNYYSPNYRLGDYIPPGGNMPLQLQTRRLNQLDFHGTPHKPRNLDNIRVIEPALDMDTRRFFENVVRPKQSLLQSELAALNQLKMAAGVQESMFQVPMLQGEVTWRRQLLATQTDMTAIVKNRPELPVSTLPPIFLDPFGSEDAIDKKMREEEEARQAAIAEEDMRHGAYGNLEKLQKYMEERKKDQGDEPAGPEQKAYNKKQYEAMYGKSFDDREKYWINPAYDELEGLDPEEQHEQDQQNLIDEIMAEDFDRQLQWEETTKQLFAEEHPEWQADQMARDKADYEYDHEAPRALPNMERDGEIFYNQYKHPSQEEFKADYNPQPPATAFAIEMEKERDQWAKAAGQKNKFSDAYNNFKIDERNDEIDRLEEEDPLDRQGFETALSHQEPEKQNEYFHDLEENMGYEPVYNEKVFDSNVDNYSMQELTSIREQLIKNKAISLQGIKKSKLTAKQLKEASEQYDQADQGIQNIDNQIRVIENAHKNGYATAKSARNKKPRRTAKEIQAETDNNMRQSRFQTANSGSKSRAGSRKNKSRSATPAVTFKIPPIPKNSMETKAVAEQRSKERKKRKGSGSRGKK